MKLSEKILKLRKQQGISQEELADRLDVSRQAVSRWEVGSAQPDASNILQLSRLFGVTADFLLNDGYESDDDVPAIKKTELADRRKVRTIIGLSLTIIGLLGNFVIYVLSRAVKVIVPIVTYRDGQKWTHWDYGHMDYSYKYFIRTHHLGFLTAAFGILMAAGLIMLVYINREKIKAAAAKRKGRRLGKAH